MVEQVTEERPAISAAIIVNDGRVLMIRRRIKEGELSWQFPAGQVEPGETFEEAAVRETAEEVGLTVRALKLLGERIHPATGRTMGYTACEVLDGEARVNDADELDAVEWCTRSRVLELVPFPFYGPVEDFMKAELRA